MALGERSMFVAEVVAGEPPQVKRLEELVYPEGISATQPQQLGETLAKFLREHQFSAKTAVVGIPVKWLVMRRKEVPPTDEATLADLLRLQAEAEFSTELKDLVYDYVAEEGSAATSVLLMATQRKFVDDMSAICQAARLNLVAITPSALALGKATSNESDRNLLVLAVNPSGSELAVQQGAATGVIRHLRSPSPQPPFVSELRRAVSTLAPTSGEREMVLWDGGGLDTDSLGEQLGFKVRSGNLPELGVEASETGLNGESSRYAPAVALALAGMTGRPAVDFLHSRLAPPKKARVPRWAILAAVAGIGLIAWGVTSYIDLQNKERDLQSKQAMIAANKPLRETAGKFVAMVSTAQAWHGGDPRYLYCLRDLTAAIPDDGQTYATNFTVREPPKAASSATSAQAKSVNPRTLIGQLNGKTADQQNVQTLIDRIRANKAFSDVKLGATQDLGRDRGVSFAVSFTYVPPDQAD
jgi:hypothetical protein